MSFLLTAPLGIDSNTLNVIPAVIDTPQLTQVIIEVCWERPAGTFSLVEITYFPSNTGVTPSPSYTQNAEQRCFTLRGLDFDQEYTVAVVTKSCPTRGQGCDPNGGNIRNPADCAAQGSSGVIALKTTMTRKFSQQRGRQI